MLFFYLYQERLAANLLALTAVPPSSNTVLGNGHPALGASWCPGRDVPRTLLELAGTAVEAYLGETMNKAEFLIHTISISEAQEGNDLRTARK